MTPFYDRTPPGELIDWAEGTTGFYKRIGPLSTPVFVSIVPLRIEVRKVASRFFPYRVYRFVDDGHGRWIMKGFSRARTVRSALNKRYDCF